MDPGSVILKFLKFYIEIYISEMVLVEIPLKSGKNKYYLDMA
jgi:hypothetical protein